MDLDVPTSVPSSLYAAFTSTLLNLKVGKIKIACLFPAYCGTPAKSFKNADLTRAFTLSLSVANANEENSITAAVKTVTNFFITILFLVK